ncbi:MAG TPA: NADP-dependent oxidoreductase [Acidimicrobiales bacterium]|nr:NADP-dependent oxidoreductase [Acidimicrobiales bacterium]
MAMQWLAADFGGPEVLKQAPIDLGPPKRGEVTIEVRAAGMNPADYKHFAAGQDPSLLPLTIGYEASGVLLAIGPGTEIATGGGAVGDEVVAFQVTGAYASHLTVTASDVFAKPTNLSFAEAANLLLVGTTAAEMLDVTRVRGGDVVLLHGAAGAVGTSALQQARLLGATVIGTAAKANFDEVARFGGVPVQYGPGLEERVRAAAPGPVTAALDTVGTDEAINVSLAAVADRQRIVTIAAPKRAKSDGLQWVGGSNPKSGPYRASQRARLLQMAARGDIIVPIAMTFSINDAPSALAALMGEHPYGKLALVL